MKKSYLISALILVVFAQLSYAVETISIGKAPPRFMSSEYSKRGNNKIVERDVPKREVKKQLSKSKVLVLMIEFPDQKHKESRDQSYFENLIFSNNSGSMFDYYSKVSYNKFSFEGKVGPWVMSGNSMKYYGYHESDSIITNLILEALQNSADYFGNNFKEFDEDNDGMIDHLIVVHAGDAEEYYSDNEHPEYIWSHRWKIPIDRIAGKTFGGLKLYNDTSTQSYTLQAESSPMGIFAHEFGHDLGLSDLYDTKSSDSCIGNYSLMDHGSWNGGPTNSPNGSSPAMLTGWERSLLGWVNIVDITNFNKSYVIKSLEKYSNDSVFRVFLDSTKKDYLLIENRFPDKDSYDEALPGKGMLIYHINEKDFTVTSNNKTYTKDIFDGEGTTETLEANMKDNKVNAFSQKRIKLLEADGLNNMGQKNSSGMVNYGTKADFFSASTRAQLLDYANNTPNSCFWNGMGYYLKSGINITDISAAANEMTFFITKDSMFNFAKSNTFDVDAIATMKKNFGKMILPDLDPNFDFNGDGKVDSSDLKILKNKMGLEIQGVKIW